MEARMTADVFLKRYASFGHPIDAMINTGPALRVNTLLIGEAELVARLESRGVVLEKIPFAKYGYWIKKSRFSLGSTAEYLRGLYYLQDAAAQVPVQVLAPKERMTVLDCCSAPGGKTTQLAQWMRNKGVIVSYEQANHRLVSLKANLERCNALNVVLFNADAATVSKIEMRFDAALVDAPCSGNLAGDPQWLRKRKLEDVQQNTPMQRKLLQAAVHAVKEGGTIVYSTCSLEPEENELIIDWALKTLPVTCASTDLEVGEPGLIAPFGQQLDPTIKNTRRLWPDAGKNEGFFVAKLVKHG